MKRGYVLIFKRADDLDGKGVRWARSVECEEDELIGAKEAEIMELEHRTGVAWECVLVHQIPIDKEGQVKLKL